MENEKDGIMSEEINKPAESAAADESRWYVVHTYSGYENKVKANIEKSENKNHIVYDSSFFQKYRFLCLRASEDEYHGLAQGEYAWKIFLAFEVIVVICRKRERI